VASYLNFEGVREGFLEKDGYVSESPFFS